MSAITSLSVNSFPIYFENPEPYPTAKDIFGKFFKIYPIIYLGNIFYNFKI